MTREIELAKQCGIAYYLTPEGTTEMHGCDRQIHAFANAIAAEERESILSSLRAREYQLDGLSDSADFASEVLRDLQGKIESRK